MSIAEELDWIEEKLVNLTCPKINCQPITFDDELKTRHDLLTILVTSHEGLEPDFSGTLELLEKRIARNSLAVVG